jgi:hypothetical protein
MAASLARRRQAGEQVLDTDEGARRELEDQELVRGRPVGKPGVLESGGRPTPGGAQISRVRSARGECRSIRPAPAFTASALLGAAVTPSTLRFDTSRAADECRDSRQNEMHTHL